METCNRHGNDKIGIHTKYHIYASYHWEVKKLCLRLFVVIYKHVYIVVILMLAIEYIT